MTSILRHSPCADRIEERTTTPKMTSAVPKIFCVDQTSARKITAKIEAKIGEELTIGTARATPMRSMPTKLRVRPKPGANSPAMTKYQIAEVKIALDGTKSATKDQATVADMVREITDAVSALDATSPRRTKICDTAKQKPARRAK